MVRVAAAQLLDLLARQILDALVGLEMVLHPEIFPLGVKPFMELQLRSGSV
jgi:hypothetical protein